MSYRDQRQDTDAYDGWGDDDANCDECGQEWDRCQCEPQRSTSPDEDPPTLDEIQAAYNASSNEAHLPF